MVINEYLLTPTTIRSDLSSFINRKYKPHIFSTLNTLNS